MEKTHPWSSFASSSPAEWRDKILEDLKGKPIDSLNWNTTMVKLIQLKFLIITMKNHLNQLKKFLGNLIPI